MEELLIVLMYTAIIGGNPQSISVIQPDMATCLERAGSLVQEDAKAVCKRMTLEEFLNVE